MVIELYADGGVVGANPSEAGGMWAFRLVVDGAVVREQAKAATPAELGLETISNNVTELLAVVCGLQAIADGRTVHVYSDSQITLIRVFQNGARKGVPDWLSQLLDAQRERFDTGRLILDGYTLLGGHPTRAELASGRRADGKPVSEHNVWCDQACTRAGAPLRQTRRAA